MNDEAKLLRLEVAQMWLLVIQATFAAAVLLWLAVSTKPSNVLRRIEEVEAARAESDARMAASLKTIEQWVLDTNVEFKKIGAKHPKIEAK